MAIVKKIKIFFKRVIRKLAQKTLSITGSFIKKYKKESLVEKIVDFLDIDFPNSIGSKEFVSFLQNSNYKYEKKVLLNVLDYPMPELPNLITFTNNTLVPLSIKENTRHVKKLIQFSSDELFAFANSPVIVTTSESRLLDLLDIEKKQKVVFIWHACGAFKKFGRLTRDMLRRKPDYVIVSGEGIRQTYAESFGLPVENVLALGLPRTEHLLDKKVIYSKKEEFYKKNPSLLGKKIYLYVPTFLEYPYRCMMRFNLDELSKLLNEDEVLLYRLHPGIVKSIERGNTPAKRCDFHPVGTNVIDMNHEETLDLLTVADVILTDYSSAFFEGLLLNKPCVFVADDIDSYQRGMYLDYRADLPGKVVETHNCVDVLEALRSATIDHPNYEKFKEYHIGACKGNITKRVADFINTL